MKLAYLVSEYPKRSHTFIRREIVELRKRGANINIFSIRKPNKSELLCEQDWDDYKDTWSILPVPIYNVLKIHLKLLIKEPNSYFSTLIAAFKHRNSGFKNGLWSIFYFVEAILLSNQIQKQDIKHLHIHFANAGADIGYLAAKYTNCTWSITIHGSCDFDYPAGTLLGKKLESVSFANCASNFGRAQAFRVVDSKFWQKIFISRCGIELDALPELVTRQSNNKFRIICVGRISSEKGHIGLIEACAKVFKEFDNAELVLIGDGPDRANIEYSIKNNGISDKVTLLGNVSEAEVLSQLVDADLFALPSLMEGVPLVLMEAMAMSIPVVAPRLAGIPELVEDRVSGLLYTPADWDDMSSKILELIEDKKMTSTLVKNGRKKVLDEFVINKSVEPLWTKLQNLSDNKN